MFSRCATQSIKTSPISNPMRPHRLAFETLEPRKMLAGDGLIGEYFDSSDLTSLAGTRTDVVVNFAGDALGDDAQGMVASDDIYSIRWTGWVKIDQPGQWQFTTFSNDGVRLWVDNNQLINNWNTHTSTRDDGSISLSAGWHPIRMEYFQQNGTTDARLLFSGPGQSEIIIPQTHLCTTDPNIGDPVADAGSDRFLVLPTNSVTLDGSATDDGTITSYAWSQLSGPNTATLAGANTEDLTASGLVQGTYEFQLTVTDNELNTDTDTAIVNVLPVGGGGVVSGDLMEWHKVTVDFVGPTVSETDTVNPFLDYRLDVTFFGPSGQQYVVPGYFAADGNAANTSAISGSVWRVHFAPDEAGQWGYAATFRAGTDVAVADDPSSFSSGGFFDGASGFFNVLPTDKSGRDMRGKGLLQYVGERYLRFAETGEYFLKQGPDAPENLFAYEDFDNTPNYGNRRKDLAPHAGDWNPGDPSWQNGKGTELIGAINYLASEGLNAFSFIPMNIGGDDRNVFPYISDNAADRTRIDVSKLAQWEIVFEHATEQGFFIHFKTQEAENVNLLDNGFLGTERKLYYRELIARFSHHPALNWNVGEEVGLGHDVSTAKKQAWADFFWNNDPYQHHIVIHNGDNHYDLLGEYNEAAGTGSELTGFSLQTSNANFSNVPGQVRNYLTRSENAGKIWAVAVDEPGDAQHALRPDDDAGNSHEDGRKNALWGALLSGAWGNEWYFGYAHDHSDLSLNDFRSRDDWWDYTRYALEFFENNEIPFWQMQNDDSISTAADDFGFFRADDTYVVYLKNGGTTSLDLTGTSGTFEVQWFDPRNGGALQLGSVGTVEGGAVVPLGDAPNSPTEDWAILVRKQQTSAKNLLFIRGSDGSGGFLEGGSDEQLADITNQQTFNGNHGWGTLADTLTGAGYTLHQVIEGSTPDGNGSPVPLSTMNLSSYDAIVFGSNNAVYAQADVDAFEQYILAGGSALFISDANFGSDWADAPNSDQQFLDLIGIEVHQDQGTYVVGNSAGEILQPDHPIFAGLGPTEVVTQFDGEGVSPFHIKQTIPGVGIMLLAGAEGNTRLNQPPFGANQQGPSVATTDEDVSAFSATYGAGRIVGHHDRNTFFNLNGAGTNITRFDNQQYAVNLFNWLTAGPNLPGDYNQDNQVDDDDLSTWTANYGTTSDFNADANDDGIVNGLDFLNWQRYVPTPTTPAPVVAFSTSQTIEASRTAIEQPTAFSSLPAIESDQIDSPLTKEHVPPPLAVSPPWLTDNAIRSLFTKLKPPQLDALRERTAFVEFETNPRLTLSEQTISAAAFPLLQESLGDELADHRTDHTLLDRMFAGLAESTQ